MGMDGFYTAYTAMPHSASGPDFAFRVANQAAPSQGERLTIDSRALNRRLHEAGLLASDDLKRGRTYMIRKRIGGKEGYALHIKEAALWGEDSEVSAIPPSPKSQ